MNAGMRRAAAFSALLSLAAAGSARGAEGPGWISRVLQSLGIQGSSGQQGNRAYRRGDYPTAIRKYSEAQDAEKIPDARLDYNTGDALYRQKRYDEAAIAYGKALKETPPGDSAFAAREHYNLGNAHFRQGEADEKSGNPEAISEYREALAHYKKSLETRPNGGDGKDAKGNLELAQIRLQQLLDKQQKQPQKNNPQKPPEPSAQAREALARALQLAQQRRYDEAMSVLEDILRRDPTAAPYRSHLQRLDDVRKILRGEKPTPPAPRDPRAAQKGLGVS